MKIDRNMSIFILTEINKIETHKIIHICFLKYKGC